MRLGESFVGQRLKAGYIAPVTPEKKVEDIMALVIPGARQRTGVSAGDDFEFREWRIAGEIFVWINIQISRMIDGQQAHLVEINDLFKRFHEAETQETMPRLDMLTFNLYIFRRVRNVAFSWPDPMTYNAGAQHVSNKTIVLTVPDPEHRTRAATAVNLGDFWRAVGGNLSFILDNTLRPKRTHDVYSAFFSQANHKVDCALAEIT